MKFTFKKLGPIKAAEMRLGKLTVIAGGNNTGKTYLAYALYGFLQMMGGQGNYFMSPRMRYLARKFLPGRMSRDRVDPRDVQEVLPLNEVEEATAAGVRHLCDIFSRWGVEEVLYAEGHFPGFSLNCEISPFAWKNFSSERMGQREMREMGLPASMMGDVEFRREGGNVVYTAENARHPQSADKSVALGCVVGFALGQMPGLFIVPAERFGAHLFYRELDLTKNRLVDILQKLPDRGPRRYAAHMLIKDSSAQYAQPIKDYIDYVRDMGRLENPSLTGGGKLHHFIEDMMGGYYEKDEGNGISFVSQTKGREAFRVPLHLASSSARGLAGFYFYLKHMARPGQLLIIDEPEAHLHPVNQMEIARLLARCVNAGLRVLITTHSDYIVKELNNLIMLSGDVRGKKAFLSKHKKTYGAADFLNKDDVRAYICEKGGLTQCDIDSRGMIMDSFNNPILEIDRISKELDARLPEEGE